MCHKRKVSITLENSVAFAIGLATDLARVIMFNAVMTSIVSLVWLTLSSQLQDPRWVGNLKKLSLQLLLKCLTLHLILFGSIFLTYIVSLMNQGELKKWKSSFPIIIALLTYWASKPLYDLKMYCFLLSLRRRSLSKIIFRVFFFCRAILYLFFISIMNQEGTKADFRCQMGTTSIAVTQPRLQWGQPSSEQL